MPISLLLAVAPAPAPAAPVPCPAAVVRLIDGLYQWHVANQDRPGPVRLGSQRSRFTPELHAQLRRADALTPADGRFVDFDVFSGTQVGTHAASVRSCQTIRADLEATVAVQVGLRGRPDPQPRLLRYRLVQGLDGHWRIADIIYPENPPFRLSGYLRELLQPRP